MIRAPGEVFKALNTSTLQRLFLTDDINSELQF